MAWFLVPFLVIFVFGILVSIPDHRKRARRLKRLSPRKIRRLEQREAIQEMHRANEVVSAAAAASAALGGGSGVGDGGCSTPGAGANC